MDQQVELHYNPETFAGPFNDDVLARFEDWLHASGQNAIHFGKSYVEHLRKFHGGVPGKRYFRIPAGGAHVLTRFLNFLPARSGHPLQSYSVQCMWSAIDDRLGDRLMPFAELFNGDMLCFDFKGLGEPEVVVWDHELSHHDSPRTEFVAKTFEEFLQMLTASPPEG